MYGAYNFKKRDKRTRCEKIKDWMSEFVEETWFHLILMVVFLSILGFVIYKTL